MKLLLLTNEFPLPVNSGGVRRQLGLIEALAGRHEVHLLAREREATPLALVDELRARLGGRPVESFPARPASWNAGPAARALRWGRATARRAPAWTESTTSPALQARAVALAGTGAFDAAVTLDDTAHDYVSALAPHIPVVLDKHNVLAWSRRVPAPASRDPKTLARFAAKRLEWWQLHEWERRTTGQAASVVVTSDDEAVRFRELYGGNPVVVPSAIPTPALIAAPADAQPRIAWLGDHGYAPNPDGLVRFAEEAWAPLGERGAQLLIAGRGATPEVLALTRLPGVEILGFVDDLDALLATCRAAVAPVWAGAGIKMKTLTLMGAGLPLVGTTVAFEGIGVTDGADGVVADEPAGLAAALGALIDEPERAAQIGAAGHDLIVRTATWSGTIGRYDEALARAVSSPRGSARPGAPSPDGPASAPPAHAA